MPRALHILNADGALDRWVVRIEHAFVRSVALVERFIPVGDVDVIVYNDAEYVVPELGVSGFCTSPRRLYIPLDINHAELGEKFEGRFQAFLAHELHHCARRSIRGYADTLLQALVTEGLACCFEAELPSGSVPMYATRVSGASLDRIWQKASLELELPIRTWGDWFFGERAPEIPNHAGYSLGYDIVSKWLTRTGQSASAAYAVSAAEVFAEASQEPPPK
jgi:uncharacterized protein YjaZ